MRHLFITIFNHLNLNRLFTLAFSFPRIGMTLIPVIGKAVFILVIVFSISFIWSDRTQAGLKTDNITEVTHNSMKIKITAPSESSAAGITQLIMVVNKDDNPKWFPQDGVEYTREQAEDAASQTGDGYIIYTEDSSNGLNHEITINNLDMGTRYLFKPWFKYDDNGIKYISSATPYASDEFYRHQDVVNSLAGELAKQTHELKQKQELTEASFTQTLLRNAADDAIDTFEQGVTEGIKSFVINGVLKKTGVGALSQFSDENAAKITRYYENAKAVYDQGKEYADIVQTVNDGLQADNPALELSRAAVTTVAPYAEPIFYVTELVVDSYVETAGIKAEIEVLTEFTEQMKKHLDQETQNLLETIKSETYFGFCVTDLGGILDHDLNLKVEDMPYVVSSDLIISQAPAIDDQDGKVTLSIADTSNLILVLLKDGVSIMVEKGAALDVQGGIFDRADDENWGAIIYNEGALGTFIMADVYNGGKNQDAQLIIRSSGEGNNGFELYPDIYASQSAGVLIDNAKVRADGYIGAKSNKGPGIWLKNPMSGTLIKRVISKFNYQGILLQGETLFDNATIGTRVGTKIEENQHPGRPTGSEDIVFMDMDYSNAMGEFINSMNMLKPIAGILFKGKEVELDEKVVNKFTIPSGTGLSILDSKLKTIRFSDHIRVEGTLNLDGKMTLLADSENIHGFIDVADGGELNAANVTFAGLDPNRNWDGIRFLESANSGILENVTFSEGGAGSIGAQLTIENYVRVTDSLFSNSRGIGVKVDQPQGRAPEFVRNKILNAEKHGLYTYNVSSTFKPRDNIFETSNGDKVHYFAVYAESSNLSKLDATHNYWDDYSGPTCTDNPYGLGATAGALVDFDPWTGKTASDPIPDSGMGSPVFNTDWDRDLHNGGYYVRAVRQSANVLSIYPLILTEIELKDSFEEGKKRYGEENLLTCYSYNATPAARIEEGGLGLYCDETVDWKKKPGSKIFFSRTAYRIVTVVKEDKPDYHYLESRPIDTGYYIPYQYRDTYEDITITAASSPYFMSGYNTEKITIEPGTIILMTGDGATLNETASLTAKNVAFISVSVPDLNDDNITTEDEIEAYMNTIKSVADIKPKGNHVKFKVYRGAGISMDNCLVINSEMGSSTSKSSTSEKGCADASFIVKNSRLYNFSLPSAGGTVEMTDNLISTYSPDPSDPYYETTFYMYASTSSDTCPVIFKNNKINIPTVNGNNGVVKYEMKIRGGPGGIDISNNEITGGVKLDVLITPDTQDLSSQRISIENNTLYNSERGIKISSDSSTYSKFFNINRLHISNNYVRTDPRLGWYCGTNCKIPPPGLAIENFNASDIGFNMEASNNDVGMASFGNVMDSGTFTLTPDLAEGLAGQDRKIALYIGDSPFSSFKINENAVFNIVGTKEEPVSILIFPAISASLNVAGEFNADHVRFIQRFDSVTADCTGKSFNPSGIRFYEDSKGKLNNITIHGMEKGLSVYSDNVDVMDSIFSDNNIALEIFNVSATVKNNRFIRNCVGISLDVDDPETDTFAAAPILQYNIFDANSNGFKINRLSGNISLKTGNKFVGSNTFTGLSIENSTKPASVDATDIFWGDDSGPDTIDNPEGTGVKIEDTPGIVTYIPWKTISDPFTITPSTGLGKGSVTPAGPVTVDYGETITFQLVPEQGYHLKNVSGTLSGTLDIAGKTFTSDRITQDGTVLANFEIDTHTLDLKYLGRGTVKGNGITCPNDCTQDYTYGTHTVLTAKGEYSYAFSNWINCDSPSGNQCTMILDGDKQCTAVFKIGDVSNDGHLNLIDPILILKTIVEKSTDAQTINYMDINQDQKIGLPEAIKGLQTVSELNP